MEEFKPENKKEVSPNEIEEIALRAAEMPEFQDAIKRVKSGMEAIIEVRKLLPRHFPEISQIPEPSAGPIWPAPSNELLIAKHIVRLLYEKSENT